MNIRDLEYLVALAEHRHFRRAADSCHVSQPTLSGQIRKLEDELGVMLLERTSRKVLFTQAGMLLVDQARTVLREVKVLKEMASQQGETMSGPLHIGLIPTVGPYLLPHIIPMLHQTFPKLEMYLHEAQTHQLLAQLDSGKLDCVILALVKESEAFIEVPLFDEPMLLAIYEDHPWANRECVPMADLAGEKLLMLEDGHCLRDQAMGFCFEAGADEDTHFRATSLETLRNMVAAGSGITLLPALAVPPERKRDGVVYLPCIKPEPRRTIGLVYRPGSPLRSRYEQLAEAIRARMDGHFDKVLKQAVYTVERSYPIGFRHGLVVKGGVDEVLNSVAATFLFHNRLTDMNNFGSALAKAVNTQNLFCFPMEQNFQRAHVHADDLCTCQMFKLGTAHFIWHFHRGQLLFSFAHRADFRDGVNAGRDIFNQMRGGFAFYQRLRGNAPLVIGR